MKDHQKPETNSSSDVEAMDPDSPESVAMDAWLAEAIGGMEPPDLSPQILRKLREQPIETGTKRVARHSKPAAMATARTGNHWQVWALAGLAVAASLAGLIWLGSQVPIIGPNLSQDPTSPSGPPKPDGLNQDGLNQDGSELATDPSSSLSPIERVAIGTSLPGEGQPGSQEKTSDSDRRGTAEAVVLQPRIEDELDPESLDLLPAPERATPGRPQAVTLVSRGVAESVHRYWNSIGVTPTPQSETEDLAERLSKVLGVDLPAGVLVGVPLAAEDSESTGSANMKSLQNWLSRPAVARRISESWWQQVTGGAFGRLSDNKREELLDAVVSCFAAGKSIDDVLVAMISGESPASPSFYQALSPGAKTAKSPGLVHQLASLTMNVDLRCVRCHDALIEGKSGQADYWNFVALLNNGLDSKQGEVRVRRAVDERQLFYELPDRRQRLATAGVASGWVHARKPSGPVVSQTPATLKQWSSELRGSTALAKGLVNSLWQLTHGRPLSGHAAHPMSAPQSDELAAIEAQIVDDLVQSDFDIRRTLMLILESPTLRRSVPEQLRDVWATDDSQAHRVAIAFAASLPAKQNLSLRQKSDQVVRASGGRVRDGSKDMLAQVVPGAPRTNSTGSKVAPLSWDFPDRADSLPVQWLHTIKTRDQQVLHLCYLAGYDRVPPLVAESVQAMQAADVDNPTLLHRVWWMVSGG